MDPEVLDDLDEGSAFENARSPFSENGMYSEQHMGGHSDDEEQPEYERDYEYVQVEEDEGRLQGHAGCPRVCTCICTC